MFPRMCSNKEFAESLPCIAGGILLFADVTYKLAIETTTASGASKILPPYGVKALRMKINLQRSHYNGKFTTDETRLL